MINALSKNIIQASNGIQLAKPSRDLIHKFSKGQLAISGSTMDFLMYLSPFVDLDGRIVIPLEQARYELYMQHNTYTRVIRESFYHKLIIRKGNEYYSRFHIHTNGSDGKLSYVKLLKVFTSSTLQGYPLRTKRLFYYFASAGRMDNWHRVKIENLYDNKIGNPKHGVKYFNTFKDVSEALLLLVFDGLIEIQLQNEITKEFETLNSNTFDLEKQYNSYFNFLNGKKNRTSKKQSNSHILNIRISPKITRDELKLKASEIEFIQLAELNCIAWNKLKPASTNFLFGYKNELFLAAGETGLSIYHNSLSTYLKEHGGSLLHYDKLGKVANYFMDFYLLNEIKNILTAAAYHQKTMAGLLKHDTTIYCNGYNVDFNIIEQLLTYFLKKGSINHKVLLDGFLFHNDICYSHLVFNHKKWLYLEDVVNTEYEATRDLMMQADAVHRPIYVNPFEWREFMILNAESGMLVKKQEMAKLINNLRSQLKSLSPNYNWIEERYPS